MDAVDHAGHVLLVINVCGLWEEGLGGKQPVIVTGDSTKHGEGARH